METRIQKVKDEFQELEKKLLDPKITSDRNKIKEVSSRHSELKEPIEVIIQLETISIALKEANDNLSDPDFAQLAEEEIRTLTTKKNTLESELKTLLIPKDPRDKKNVIIEIRGGAGGGESALFAADLFRMYSRYAEIQGWQISIINSNKTEIGGYKEIVFNIKGRNAFAAYKFESGVHRVQRVPSTEKSGRVHTSTATVAVLTEAEEVDFIIETKDLRIDTFRASGAGGQHVNKTDSAIRITHVPTNTVVGCQSERSQQQNKDKAMVLLRSKLLSQQEEERLKEIGDQRRSQVGSGDRSEKIRTYNFPQDRITDHRIKHSWNSISLIMDGQMQNIITTLQEEANKLVST